MIYFNDVTKFSSDLKNRNVFLFPLLRNNKHPAKNSIISLFIKSPDSPNTYVFNFDHQDIDGMNSTARELFEKVIMICKKIFVLDKKTYLYSFPTSDKVVDIQLVEHQFGNNISEEISNLTNKLDVFFEGSEKIINEVIPMSKHIQRFLSINSMVEKTIMDFKPHESFEYSNNIVTEILFGIEKSGLYIDREKFNNYFSDRGIIESDDFVYTQYNLLTSTGRPSNRFEKVNYAALNTENGCRESFVSRFGSDGCLCNFDYNAYHPHIIASQINYKVGVDENIYEIFAKEYFSKTEVSAEEIKYAKNKTFQNLYGNICEDLMRVDFFRLTKDYIDNRWNFFSENGYVETFVFKRKITNNHIKDPNPNKLFNYLLQAAELEYFVSKMKIVLDILKGYKTLPILYTYDSVLFDFYKPDGVELIREIRRNMVNNTFPVKVHLGKDYGNLLEITNRL